MNYWSINTRADLIKSLEYTWYIVFLPWHKLDTIHVTVGTQHDKSQNAKLYLFNFDKFLQFLHFEGNLSAKEKQFHLWKKNVIFWHPWDPWGRVHIDLDKNSVASGCVKLVERGQNWSKLVMTFLVPETFIWTFRNPIFLLYDHSH